MSRRCTGFSYSLLGGYQAVWRAQGARGAGAWKLFRAPAEPARLPYAPEAGWHFMLWKALAEGVTSITGGTLHPDLL